MMGLPIDKLVIASNENNILTRFVNNGDYSIKNVVETYSPSMDIQIASNFERYLYYLYNDPEIVVEKMRQLSLQKKIIFTDEELKRVRKDFAAHYTTNEETLETIKEFYEKYNYILDPHTACGVNAALKLNLEGVNVCLATAHPAKFFDPIQKALRVTPKEPEGIKRLKGLPKKVYEVENRVEAVKTFIQEKLK
jgi:threonine synthase